MNVAMEQLNGYDLGSGRLRPFHSLFKWFDRLSNSHDCDYALFGSMAAAVMTRPRIVPGPDWLVSGAAFSRLLHDISEDALVSRSEQELTFRFHVNGVCPLPFRLHTAESTLDKIAIKRAQPCHLFGMAVPVSTKVAVFRYLALSTDPYEQLDAVTMLLKDSNLLDILTAAETDGPGAELNRVGEKLMKAASRERHRKTALIRHLSNQVHRVCDVPIALKLKELERGVL